MSQAVLSSQELEHLAEVREVCHSVTTPGWGRILRQIETFVEESKEEMVGNLSSDPMTYMRLQLRWQQREAMLRGIKQYIQDCEDSKKLLLEQAADNERSGVPTYDIAES